jgi:hypothetical protein
MRPDHILSFKGRSEEGMGPDHEGCPILLPAHSLKEREDR